MDNSQHKAWDHRYYDSYRPDTKRESFSEHRSPKFATEFKAVRYHSNHGWHWRNLSVKTNPQSDASSTLKPSRGQTENHTLPAAFMPTEKSPSTGNSQEQLVQMPQRERKKDTAPSRRSSHTVDPDKRNKSEAQSRGFYGSSRSPNSDVAYLGKYELKRPGNEDITDRSVKRRRDTEEEGEGNKPAGTSDSHSPLPRLRRSPALTPLVSPLQSLQMSLEPGEVLSARPQMLGEPPSNSSQHRRLGLGTIPPQAPVRLLDEHESHPPGQREAYVPLTSPAKKEDASLASGRTDDYHSPALTHDEDHPSQPPSRADHPSSTSHTRNEDHRAPISAPTEDSPDDDDSLDTIETRMRAFEADERVKQERHDEEQARRRRQQRMEFERELEEKITQKKHDADLARRAAAQRQEEEHESRLAEVRRR